MNKSKWIIIGIIALAVYAYYDDAKQKDAYDDAKQKDALRLERATNAMHELMQQQQQQSVPQSSRSGERLIDQSSAGYYDGPVPYTPNIDYGDDDDVTPSSSNGTMTRSEQLKLKHRMERDLEAEAKALEMASRHDASMSDIRYYHEMHRINEKRYGSGSSR